jgi:stress response protein YsnF
VERPVEQQVGLRDETVKVERRPPTQAVPGERPFEDKVVEVSEKREEPVIRKVVKPGDEVVVRKETKDRTETVRDTVRESKVEVEQAGGGKGPPEKGR